MAETSTMNLMTRRSRASWQREDTSEGSSYLADILKMHKAGIPSTVIGREKGKDHTTILYHLRKMGVLKGVGRGHRRPLALVELSITTIQITTVSAPVPKVSKYDHLFNEPVNQGRTYKEYLQRSGKSPAEVKKILAQKVNAARAGGASYEFPTRFGLAG